QPHSRHAPVVRFRWTHNGFRPRTRPLYLDYLAYGIRYSCFIVSDADLLSGGPKWVLTDRLDAQGVIPAGTPSYTLQQLQSGAAPELQSMLRNLLTDGFKLAIHRTTKDMRVYVLT